jgi:hypothetical protein
MENGSAAWVIFVAFRLGPGAPTSQRKNRFEADSVIRATRDHSTSGAPDR